MMDKSLCAWARERLPLWPGPSAHAPASRGPSAFDDARETEPADDDGLDARDRALLERHLADCPACAAHRASLDDALDALARAADVWPLASDAPSVWPALERRIAAREETRAPARSGAWTNGTARRVLRNWRGRARAFLDLDRPLRLLWTRDALAEALHQLRANRNRNARAFASAKDNINDAGPIGAGAGAPRWAMFSGAAIVAAGALMLTYLGPAARSPSTERPRGAAPQRDSRSSTALQASRGDHEQQERAPRRRRRRPRPYRYLAGRQSTSSNAGVSAGPRVGGREREPAGLAEAEAFTEFHPWGNDTGAHWTADASTSAGPRDAGSVLPGAGELARADVPPANATAPASTRSPAPTPTTPAEPEAGAEIEVKTETTTRTKSATEAPPAADVGIGGPAPAAHRWNYDLEHGFPMSDDDDVKPVY